MRGAGRTGAKTHPHAGAVRRRGRNSGQVRKLRIISHDPYLSPLSPRQFPGFGFKSPAIYANVFITGIFPFYSSKIKGEAAVGQGWSTPQTSGRNSLPP
ncbi:hypothetical protein HMPREF0578_1272 [Mobiluncus mulieris 28-1]|nr:hypothetical protein HMPREF0578_1272 [Mobiluncus mulieris 28-1]